MPWAKRATKPIPSQGSRSQTLEINDYSLGFNSYIGNDRFPLKDGSANMWRLARNARIVTLGEYETRKGFDFASAAAGETKDDNQESTTGAADQSFSGTVRIAQKFTTTTAGMLTKVDVRLKNDAGATGTVMVEVWSNAASAPGTMLTRSSIAASTISSSYAYLSAYFAEAAVLASTTDYWIVVYTQSGGTGSYKWSSTTSGTDSLTSINSGVSYSSNSFAMNFKQYYSTSAGTKGMHRAYKSDGTKVTLFAHGTTLYSVNEVTGALTAIKTGLSASATHYRFETVNDIVYYVNGFDGYRKWDFTTESQVSATNYTHIKEHKGLMWLVTKDDPNKVVFSNFADYETFTSTDFIYIPSPKTGDPVTAILPLNGNMIVWTLDNKYIIGGDDNATFALDEAPDQKGTFTQETVAWDKNFAYYLSDDGVYKTNGSEPALMSENIYEEIKSLANKDSSCLVRSKGRLYMWVRPTGQASNSVCYVWNINFSGDKDTVESYDTKAFVCRAVSAYRDNNELITASSLVGQVFWQERESNDYTNAGGDIEFELQTNYMTFGSPAVMKEVRTWQPRFASQSENYSVGAEYATDLRGSWTNLVDINVVGAGSTYGSGETYGGGSTYGTEAENQSYLYIPGEYRRIALRYKHYATRQPNTFLGHTLVVQSRRLR